MRQQGAAPAAIPPDFIAAGDQKRDAEGNKS